STARARRTPRLRRATAIALWLLAWLVPWTVSCAAPASNAKVLILNSNGAVKKYATIENAFQSNLAIPTARLDLAGGSGSPDALKENLKSSDAALIYAIGSNAYQLASRNAKQPIVFSSILNWRRQRMGDNVYGIANELPSGMPLSLFRYLFPELKTIGVLYSETFNKEWLAEAVGAAADVRIELIGEKVAAPSELPQALARLLPRVDALWLISDPVVLATENSAIELFRRSDAGKKPVFAYDDVFVDLGAVLAITADIPTMGIQAAKLAEDVLMGRETPPEHVQNPAGSHITLHMGRVQRYGIHLNRQALGAVNRVVE
ncbi:MAG TPA: ABC transporter substrate binding protein, partial [Methylococcaceae bacterium]|nr:ABC transporter substrate binding protein [Methylococcaceae bacterium]